MERACECLRCKSPMKYLKQYRFDSRDENRGLFGAIFDIEEHLTFDIYVCPDCRHTEFFLSDIHETFDR